MDDTILHDDRGETVDVFEEILTKFENIGAMCSGGVDSSFTLYWLAHCIDVTGRHNTHSILPMTLLEPLSELAYCNIKEVQQIIQLVKDNFPKVSILDHYVYECKDNHPTDGDEKKFTNKKHRDMLLNAGMVDHIVGSVCAAPVFEDIDFGWIISTQRDISNQTNKLEVVGDIYRLQSPFGFVDKKFAAYNYKKYDLMDSIFPLTKSCVDPDVNGSPCRNCSWCLEKYWAYGMYDDCIDSPEPNWAAAKNWHKQGTEPHIYHD